MLPPLNSPCDKMRVNNDTVRKLAVFKQGLDKHPTEKNKKKMLEIINKIGLLQIDTINVVERSHYLVMFSRLGNYNAAELDSLLHPDRKLFEQWAHVASILPMNDYPYFAPIIAARREIEHRRLKRIGKNADQLLAQILKRIKTEGALASRHFDSQTRGKSGSWWDWKPHKFALQILFDEGYLMVDKRVAFQRYYDLTERVLPKEMRNATIQIGDSKRWFVLKALSCLGIATVRQIADYYRHRYERDRIHLRILIERRRHKESGGRWLGGKCILQKRRSTKSQGDREWGA